MSETSNDKCDYSTFTKQEYNQWIKDGQPINLLVTTCNISNSNINSLNGIEKLVNLKILGCYSNQLTSLNEIEKLVNLTGLYCGGNQLISLNGIEKLVNLKTLNCGKNHLIIIAEIENLVNLKNVYNDGQNVDYLL